LKLLLEGLTLFSLAGFERFNGDALECCGNIGGDAKVEGGLFLGAEAARIKASDAAEDQQGFEIKT
jgi:hypothetical protein